MLRRPARLPGAVGSDALRVFAIQPGCRGQSVFPLHFPLFLIHGFVRALQEELGILLHGGAARTPGDAAIAADADRNLVVFSGSAPVLIDLLPKAALKALGRY